ncbi:MAG: YDG domain-containing protein [Prevotella sp.]|nr:YDG domain-containing protein [Prevotella sp.]
MTKISKQLKIVVGCWCVALVLLLAGVLVCVNLPVDASTNSAGVFVLSADGLVNPVRGTWDECYAMIKADLTTTYTLTMQGDWYPTQQIVLNDGGKIILDLNGYTIDGSNCDLNGNTVQSFFTKDDSLLDDDRDETSPVKFIIRDMSSTQTGKIAKFRDNVMTLDDMDLVQIEGGTFTENYKSIITGATNIVMTGGMITQNELVHYVFATSSSITISGGEICDNYAAINIVHGMSKGAFQMSGGKIHHNRNGINVNSGSYVIDIVGNVFNMTGGAIYDNVGAEGEPRPQVSLLTNHPATLDATITGGKIVGDIEITSGAILVLGDNIEQTADGYFEKVHAWGDWIIDATATDDTAGTRHHECVTCYEKTADESIPQLVLPAIEVTYDGTNQEIKYLGTPPAWLTDDMVITYTQDGQAVTAVQDVGTYTATVRVSDFERTTTVTVLPRPITVDNLLVKDRVYNGTTSVTFDDDNVKITGIVAGDSPNVSVQWWGRYVDKNVGTDKMVTVTLDLSGNQAHNYTLVKQYTTTATITPRTLTITNIKAVDKVYDGDTRAILDLSKITYNPQIYTGDDVTVLVVGEYAQANVGTWKVTLNYDLGLDGADKDNYQIAQSNNQVDVTASIQRRALTIAIDDQTVKEGEVLKTLTARVTSGNLVGNDKITDLITLSLSLPDATDPNNLPAGKYQIMGAMNDNEIAANYQITLNGVGEYTVLSDTDFDALQPQTTPEDDGNSWQTVLIVTAVAAAIGALVGVGLVVRTYSTRRDTKKESKKDTKKPDKKPTEKKSK